MSVVDAVAKAICTAEGDNPSEYKHYRASAQAAIAAYRSAQGNDDAEMWQGVQSMYSKIDGASSGMENPTP